MPPIPSRAIRRLVSIGGCTKAELLLRLQAADVRLNDLAGALFSDPRFTTSSVALPLQTVELTVADLQLPEGGTFAAIIRQASAHGLVVCPLELGPYLRLGLLDQPEGHIGQAPSQNRAPPGSITIVSAPFATDDDTPKGFYLRRIDGLLWLRGYRSWAGHIWSPADRLVFRVSSDAI